MKGYFFTKDLAARLQNDRSGLVLNACICVTRSRLISPLTVGVSLLFCSSRDVALIHSIIDGLQRCGIVNSLLGITDEEDEATDIVSSISGESASRLLVCSELLEEHG